MRYFKYKKLVRDKIIENIKNSGQKPFGVKVLNNKTFIRELIKKLIEESSEMLKVKNTNELNKELADIVEIINYLKIELKLSDKLLNELLKSKRDKSGGFNKRLYLDKVGITDNNEWKEYYLNNTLKYPEVK